MKKLNFLTFHTFKKRVEKKSFLITNIIMAVLLIALINLPNIIGAFDTEPIDKKINIIVVNEVPTLEKIGSDLSEKLNTDYSSYDFTVALKETKDVDSFWEDNDIDVLVHFSGDIDNPVVNVYTKDDNILGMITTSIDYLFIYYKVGHYNKPQFNITFPPNYEDDAYKTVVNGIVNILIVPMFILIIMGMQFLGIDIIEEKSSKAIETIISSVPAKTHFTSKILGVMLFIIFQSLLLFIYSIIGILISSAISNKLAIDFNLLKMLNEFMPNWKSVLIATILFILLGSLLYLVLGALFASMATSQEDYQQIQLPVVFTLLIGFYIGIFATAAQADTLLKVTAYIPLFSPLIAPAAYAAGIISNLEVIIILIILLFFVLLVIYIVEPIYRVSILSYEQTKVFKRLKSYFKKGYSK